QVERHLAHGGQLPRGRGEGHREVANAQQRTRGVRHATVFRGSKASRTASPTNTSRLSMVARTMNPVRPIHGAWRFALPWARTSPSDGDPGGRPKPRKSSEVRVVMDPFRMKGRKVSAATMALGSTCRTMMTRLRTPRARAART